MSSLLYCSFCFVDPLLDSDEFKVTVVNGHATCQDHLKFALPVSWTQCIHEMRIVHTAESTTQTTVMEKFE